MMPNKFHNKKVTVNGITFDSKAEAQRYNELVLLLKAGEISDIELQPKFLLQPSYKKNGKTIREINYIADFAYNDFETRKKIIEDVKGVKTKEYILKKKIFEYKYPDLEIKEIMY